MNRAAIADVTLASSGRRLESRGSSVSGILTVYTEACDPRSGSHHERVVLGVRGSGRDISGRQVERRRVYQFTAGLGSRAGLLNGPSRSESPRLGYIACKPSSRAVT